MALEITKKVSKHHAEDNKSLGVARNLPHMFGFPLYFLHEQALLTLRVVNKKKLNDQRCREVKGLQWSDFHTPALNEMCNKCAFKCTLLTGVLTPLLIKSIRFPLLRFKRDKQNCVFIQPTMLLMEKNHLKSPSVPFASILNGTQLILIWIYLFALRPFSEFQSSVQCLRVWVSL